MSQRIEDILTDKTADTKIVKGSPSSIKTIAREIEGKFEGVVFLIIGFIFFLIGVIVLVAHLRSSYKDSAGLVISVVFLTFGIILNFIGKHKIMKARFIAWVLEALEIYDSAKK